MIEADQIETPENVTLERQLAGIGSRFVAAIIDALWQFLILLVLVLAIFLLGLAGLSEVYGLIAKGALNWSLAILVVVVFLIYWGYFVFFEMVTNGQSPGKRSQKLRVVKESGAPVTFTDSAIRNLLRAADALMFYAVGVVAMFISRKSQRLGDMAAGTVVVCEGHAGYVSESDRRRRVKEPRATEVTADALRATGLSPEDFRILASFRARQGQLTQETRERLLRELVAPILERNGIETKGMAARELGAALTRLMWPAEVGLPPAGPSQPGARR